MDAVDAVERGETGAQRRAGLGGGELALRDAKSDGARPAEDLDPAEGGQKRGTGMGAGVSAVLSTALRPAKAAEG